MRRITLLVVLLIAASLLAGFEPSLVPVRKSDVGYVFFSLERDSVVLSLNADMPFIYASNVKLITTAAALCYLGGGFKLSTRLAYDPATHTLYVEGGAQTTATSEDLRTLAADLAERGMTPVDTLVIDDALYGARRYTLGEGEDDEGDYAYLAYTGPLCLNGNTARIAITPGDVGEPPRVRLRPPSDYFIIDNRATTVTGNGNTIGLSTFDADGHTRILVAGNIGVERHVPVTFTKRIYHPSEYYAASLLAYLGASAETAVRYADVSDSVFTCDSLYTYRMTSAPLREMIRVMNVHSSNMMAESFTRVLGLQELNDPDAGPRVLERFCREELGEETALVNGSGLGNGYNAVTPTLMMKLLRWAWANPMMGIDLFASLPVWGEDGTLAKPPEFRQPGVIRAKTGSLSNVSALSGLMRGSSGSMYLFTWVVNRYPARAPFTRAVFRDRMMQAVWDEL